MTFFNTKEEVLDIQLTPYGKYLLSNGNFSPMYYDFFDDDILYDSQYGGQQEYQEEIQQRIKQTKRTKVQYTFNNPTVRSGQYLKRKNDNLELNDIIVEKRKNFSFPVLPLGTNSNNSNLLPYSTIKFKNIEISSSAITNINNVPTSIKNIELFPKEMKISLKQKASGEPQYSPLVIEDIGEDLRVSNYFSTKTIREINFKNSRIEVSVEEPYILIDIEENEVEISNNNYEIYLYEIDVNDENEEIETPLSFVKENKNVIDGILLDQDELPDRSYNLDNSYVNYYFSVLTDRQIPPNILCKHLTDEEIQKLVQVDGYNIDCNKIRRIEKLENQELNTSEEDLRNAEEC